MLAKLECALTHRRTANHLIDLLSCSVCRTTCSRTTGLPGLWTRSVVVRPFSPFRERSAPADLPQRSLRASARSVWGAAIHAEATLRPLQALLARGVQVHCEPVYRHRVRAVVDEQQWEDNEMRAKVEQQLERLEQEALARLWQVLDSTTAPDMGVLPFMSDHHVALLACCMANNTSCTDLTRAHQHDPTSLGVRVHAWWRDLARNAHPCTVRSMAAWVPRRSKARA